MSKYDLFIQPPYMNAAGSLGFAPNSHGPVDLGRLGVFVTNPVSLQARTIARGRRLAAFQGGFLLHTGYPNPGLSAVIRHYAPRWARSDLPVIVHLMVQEVSELPGMVERLEALEGVMGVELGLPLGMNENELQGLMELARGELPLIVRLPFESAMGLASTAVEAGAAAVSLSPPRGLVASGTTGITSGRLYGPGLLPQALGLVQALARLDIPIIGAGGIYSERDAAAMLRLGALAVQLDACLWRGDWLEA
jgi:dihydroorotate dehydrogenase (NAD+) catalytic subunit